MSSDATPSGVVARIWPSGIASNNRSFTELASKKSLVWLPCFTVLNGIVVNSPAMPVSVTLNARRRAWRSRVVCPDACAESRRTSRTIPYRAYCGTFAQWGRGQRSPRDSSLRRLLFPRQVAAGRLRVRRSHQSLSHQHRVHPDLLELLHVGACVDAGLGHHGLPGGHVGEELERDVQVHCERHEVPVVDP